MDLQSIELNLAAVEVPKPSRGNTASGGKPVFWGDKHGFQPKVLGLIKNSPTASAMLNRRARLIAGQGFKTDADKLGRLAEWMKKIASEGRYRTADALFARVSKDYSKLRAAAVQVVWAPDGQHIAELYHQRIETVAPGLMDDEENINDYFLCRDWTNTRRYKVQHIPAFNPEAAASTDPKIREANQVQLAVFYEEDAGSEYFPDLDFQAGLNYMEAEALLGEFHPNNIANKFSLGSILSIANGPTDQPDPDDASKVITAAEQQKEFIKKLKKTFTGTKAEQLMVLFGDGDTQADHMAKLQAYTAGTNETLYESIAKMCQQAILSSGGVTSPEVVGLPSVGGLGGDGGKLAEAYQMYFNTVCRPDQLALLGWFKELFAFVDGVSFDGEPEEAPWLDITTTLPVRFMFGEDTLLALCTDAELRTMMDLPAQPAEPEQAKGNDTPQLTQEQKALASNPGSQAAIDAMLGLLAQGNCTRESCIARLTVFFGLSDAQAQAIVPMPAQPDQTPAGALPAAA